MKKFLYEYKAFRSKSETETSKERNTVESPQEMGVFKWLRRERVTVTTHEANATTPDEHSRSATHVGTIRTEEYKRDLAEFQARRPSGNRELPETPVKKKCGRHSLPVSCTDCATDHDNTFNYEKKSAMKYEKKSHKRARSAAPEEGPREGVPNIQFLFQNQVFMPGNLFPTGSFTDPRKKRPHRRYRSPEIEFSVQKRIDFNEDHMESPPLFYKNNSLPFDTKNFLEASRSRTDEEEVDGLKSAGGVKVSSQNSSGRERDDSCEDKLWEVMSELKHFDQWADEQLQTQSPTKSEDSKSDTSAYGLPIVSSSNLDVEMDRSRMWSQGTWGVVPVQMKRLAGVTVEHIKRRCNTEVDILRKCRHPNIILLMGLYPDARNDVHIICEQCIDSLFDILHVQGRILSAQTSVHYALDIANALLFLRMQGYVHTELTSHAVMVTGHDAAKLADVGPCVKLTRTMERERKGYEVYSPEPQYVNVEESRSESNGPDSEPLISKRSSELYLETNSVAKPYDTYRNSEHYRWQAPELFVPDDDGMVHPCAKSDVYSLSVILWESCNALLPWQHSPYGKLLESYTSWCTGIRLPQDGTYPGSLLALLQAGLKLSRADRIDLATLQGTLRDVKRNLDDLEYIIIPARLPKKKSGFSSTAWDTSPTDESDCQSPISQNIQHKAIIHNTTDSSTESSEEKDCSKSDKSPLYETIRKDRRETTFSVPEKCFISDEDNVEEVPMLKYTHLPEKDYSSACSTPIAKIRARIKDIGTPGTLHRSDSTEYCSILSPDRRFFGLNDESNSIERPTAKLSRSFTPKSYKPLHIKVPEFNLDSVKSILKEQNGTEKPSYNFDITNYSLPTTPIARSNKLRKNAWLSGDLNANERSSDKSRDNSKTPDKEVGNKKSQSAPETPAVTTTSSIDKEANTDIGISKELFREKHEESPESVDTGRDSYTGLRRTDPPLDFSTEAEDNTRERTSSWSFRASGRNHAKSRVEDDILASVNVKPLVAIHERWIYEANRKTGRSMSLPEDNRIQIQAVKPASHCVDTLQKSLPQLNLKRPSAKPFRSHPVSPSNGGKNGPQWEQFCQARDTIAKSINFTSRDPDRFNTWKKDSEKWTITEETHCESKVDQATDTRSIEEFIRDLIRKEFQHLLHEISDDPAHKNEDLINKGVANIIENLKNPEDADQTVKKDQIKSFSRVKINGNNKPLLQITFSRSGENSLQVLDNCVNVTICDGGAGGREKLSISTEDTLTEDVQVHSLKRCQAFNAIQEARSTEDLYIDDDLSAQMQENFGGKVKLIPLHGSLHEILCEKEDECCLIKVKQENGCDTIYFRCDNSDTESRDAIDGCAHDNRPQDTVVFKRHISLIEERIQRVFPKDKKVVTPVASRKRRDDTMQTRPKSEVFLHNISKESRVLSNSSPSLIMKGDKNDEVEVNIENVMCYQDSSSDECLKCQAETDDFEFLERKIEEDLANSNLSTCGCLQKISEENLSASNEEVWKND